MSGLSLPPPIHLQLLGPLMRPGLAEVPITSPLVEVINHFGGGLPAGHHLKAVLLIGPGGGLLPVERLQLPLAHEIWRTWREASATPTLEVLDERTCIVSLVQERVMGLLVPGSVSDATDSTANLLISQFHLTENRKPKTENGIKDPARTCRACRPALERLGAVLANLTAGEAEAASLEELARGGDTLQRTCDCPSAQEAASLIQTSLTYFRAEYRLHLENNNCPAQVCPKLRLAPCQQACPAGIDIPAYLALASQGRFQEALEVIRQDNPFPWVCGLTCPHPCEKVCTRATLDEPVNIRYLKAFVADWALKHGAYAPLAPAPPQGRRVAVVGSGPAGLSCAHYLALAGYQVTVFEAQDEPGGLLAAGIPEYRLPRTVVGREIDLIRSLGVEIRTGVAVGRDITMEELRFQGYAAFFLGIGAHLGFKLKIAGENDFPQVYDAITFLREVRLGRMAPPAPRVVVVGGGNAAMDAARTCVRLGCEEVHISYRRTRKEMPAHAAEVEQALAEGVQFHFLSVPLKIGGENGRVTYLECLRAELGEPDADGRRRPAPVPGSNYRLEVGAVITAIGQQPDFCLFPEPPVQTSPWCTVITTPGGTQTSVPDIFAGGDCVTGPATVVAAIAAGKQAARDIGHFLSGAPGPAPPVLASKRLKVPFTPMSADDKIGSRRVPMPLLDPAARRRSFAPVELGYGPDQARTEARRCLRCDVCIRCGACEKVCRDHMQIHALAFSPVTDGDRVLTDYPRVRERCLTCGACALACPTGAMEYREGPDYRELSLCGALLNRLEAPPCQACGAPLVPPRYLQYVTQRSDLAMGKMVLRRLCPACARQKRAAKFVKLG